LHEEPGEASGEEGAEEVALLVADTVRSVRACQMQLILPDALRVQALWAMRKHRWQEAESVLDEAIALCRALSYPYPEAKALYVSGQLWAMRAESKRALACFDEALAICRRLGERLYGEMIERSIAVATAAAHVSQSGYDRDLNVGRRARG